MPFLSGSSAKRRSRRRTCRFETLEDRSLLSIAAQLSVSTLLDTASQVSPLAQQAAHLNVAAATALLGNVALMNPALLSPAPFPLAPVAAAASPSSTGDLPALGASPGATYQTVYSTGFEASEGYAQGFIDGQNGWTAFNLPLSGAAAASNTMAPSIATGNAAGGQQHLHLGEDWALGYGNYIVGAASPAFEAPSSGCYTVSIDMSLDNQGNQGLTSWFVAAMSDANVETGRLTSDICFAYTGEISVLTNVGNTLQWVSTGKTWTRSQHQRLTLNVDANNAQVQYFLGQELIFTGALWGAPVVRQLLVYDINTWVYWVGSDFDNLSVAQTLLMPARAKAWWDDRLIVSSNPGDNAADVLYPTDSLYVDWAVQNVGAAATNAASTAKLYVDGVLRQTQTVPADLGSWACYAVEDFEIGSLAVGRHTLRLVPDADGAAGDNNGLDGGYTKTITIEPWGEISGVKWDDLDSDGIRDEGEPGVSDWSLYLDLNRNSQCDAGEPTALTAADGGYRFTGLRAGTYAVGETGGAVDVQVDPGQTAAGPSGPLTLDNLPSAFDLRNVDNASYVTAVRDQGMMGNCWGFATYGSLESSILKAGGLAVDFSENHQKNYNGFDLWAVEGGYVSISQAYLSRGSGPVNESDDPYHDWDDMPSPGGTPSYYARESLVFDTPEEIKAAVATYGAVFTDMCWDWSSYDYTDPAFRYTFYYNGAAPSNHAVTIVGWDDGKITKAGTPGAWLIKNSWGTEANDGTNKYFDAGYFWISYADANAGHTAIAFCDAVPAASYDRIYAYDEHGRVGELDATMAANAFTPAVNESLRAVQFFTGSDGVGYDIEVYDAFDGLAFSGLLASVSGTEAYAGGHTVDLPTPAELTAGRTFYVLLRLTGGGAYPMAFDFAAAGYSSTSTAQPGQSFCFDPDANAWIDLTAVVDESGQIDLSTANFCIKALTRDVLLPAANEVMISAGGQAGGVDFAGAALHSATVFAPSALDENLSAGAVAGALFTTAADAGPFTYSLTAGVGDADNASFVIDGDQLMTIAPLDFESQNVYSVRVRTAAASGLWSESFLTIRVLDVNDAPTVAVSALASPDVVDGLSTVLSILGADDHGEEKLLYHWSASGPATVAWSDNDSNAAKNATAAFQAAGQYVVTVTVTDFEGASTVSSASVTVLQTLTAATISPAAASLAGGQTQQFTATALDQFNQAFVAPPTFAWTASAGTVDAAGLFTAPLIDGAAVVTASYGGWSAAANVSIATPPQIAAWQSVARHGAVVGDVALAIGADDKFSEPRTAGVRQLLVFFSEPIAAESFSSAAVGIAGNRTGSVAVDLRTLSINVGLQNEGLVGVIDFSPALPDQARYVVRLTGLLDLAGNALAGDNDRVITALKGDANGDLRVNVTDLSYIQSVTAAAGSRLTPTIAKQVRSDVNLDGRVNVNDLSAAWAQRSHDVRSVAVPTLPAALPLPAPTLASASPVRADAALAPNTTLLAASAGATTASAPASLKIDWSRIEAASVDWLLAAWR